MKDPTLDRTTTTIAVDEARDEVVPQNVSALSARHWLDDNQPLDPDCTDGDHALDEQLLVGFLAQLEPHAPPPGLVESIEALTLEPPSRARREEKRPTLAWEGARWAVEGPMRGLRTLAIPAYGTEQAWQGVSTLRFALGPLFRERPRPRPKPKRNSWWRQAVRLWG